LSFWAYDDSKPIQRLVQRNRQACYSLLQAHGKEGVQRLIERAALAQTTEFAPVITDFISLQIKLNALKIWEARNNTPAALPYPNVGAMLYPEKYGKVAA
jgi:hypothetical protein